MHLEKLLEMPQTDLVKEDIILLSEEYGIITPYTSFLVLESDAGTARQLARQHLATYLGLPNYTNHWKRIGFTDDDLRDGGSDRLVDALYAWGD